MFKNPALDDSRNLVFLLAHGAGAPADSPFMNQLAEALAKQGADVLRFEFPYMQKRRDDGRKRPPDRQPVLLNHFRNQVETVRSTLSSDQKLIVGGKSMGGRMASLLASGDEVEGIIDGCACFGYPFHPPGKLDRWRIDHFRAAACPIIVLQGTRDPFGKKDEIDGLAAGALGEATVEWLDGGNHDFKPPAKSASTQLALIQQAATAAVGFFTR